MIEELRKVEEETLTYSAKKISGSRIGRLVEIKANGEVLVDFEENPFPDPLAARLGKPFHLDDLKQALELNRDLRLKFIDGNPKLPVIQNIYYSILEEVTKETSEIEDEQLFNEDEDLLEINSRKLIFNADEIILRSSGKIKLEAEEDISFNSMGNLIQRAKNILSSANLFNRIKGSNVDIN